MLRTARYVEHGELTETSEVVETGQVMLFIGPEFVITRPARRRLPAGARSAPTWSPAHELLAQGPWAVAYAITDRVVDLYIEVADAGGERPRRAGGPRSSRRQVHGRIQRIYQMKRELVEFKRAVMPLQRPLVALTSPTDRAVPKEIRRYFRDVQDHLTAGRRAGRSSYDDLLNSILQARLAQVTVEQNNDMRKIAAWAAIAAVQTVHRRRLRHELPGTCRRPSGSTAIPALLAVMFSLVLIMYRGFRRSGWL